MYRKSGVIIVMSLMTTMLWSASASAHVLKKSGTISALLHIQPEDSPVSGVPTQYILYFHDTAGRLSLAACDCKVTIQENGRTLLSEALTPQGEAVTENTYQFPKPDVYTLVVSGQPKTAGAFDTFSMTYPVRVTGRSSDGNAEILTDLKITGIALAGIAVLVGLFYVVRGR